MEFILALVILGLITLGFYLTTRDDLDDTPPLATPRRSKSMADIEKMAEEAIKETIEELKAEEELEAAEPVVEEPVVEEPAPVVKPKLPAQSVLEKKTKAELVTFAAEHGITLSPNKVKAELIAMLQFEFKAKYKK